MRSARHRPSRARRPRGPLVVSATIVAGCAVWGWTGREAPPVPPVASAPVSPASAPADPGAAAPSPSPRRTAGPEEDARFVQELVVLDAQAVLLAQTLDGQDPEVAALAARIREDRDPDLPVMVSWLEEGSAPVPTEATDPGRTDPDAYPDLPGGISTSQLGHLERARGSNADRLFLGLLLTHDQGAVAMAEQHAGETGDEGLRSLAGSVERYRSDRIQQVSAMLERLT